MTKPVLFDYFRSSASYRVRIALNLKGIDHESVAVDLRAGAQRDATYRERNPQGFVPMLEIDGQRLTQSLAIIAYVEETRPDPPLLPPDPADRALVRAMALTVACDIHPLNNLRVLQFFENTWHVPQPEREDWVKHWIAEGFAAIETLLADHPSTGRFCEGDTPSIADCCLLPQVYNARRFGVSMDAYPTIARIEAECLAMDAFDAARPERQPDAP